MFLLFCVSVVVVIHIVLQVVARQKAAAGALQTSIQHHTTASGEKYALPDKLAAKNKSVSHYIYNSIKVDWGNIVL